MSQQPSFSIKAMILILTLSLCNWAFAGPNDSGATEKPGAMAMAADLVIVRPVMLGVTVVGSALWLLALPFSAAGGNIKQSADTLVVSPAKNTFVRCLGCRKTGYIPEFEKQE